MLFSELSLSDDFLMKEVDQKDYGKAIELLANSFEKNRIYTNFFKQNIKQRLKAYFQFILNICGKTSRLKGIQLNNHLLGLMIYEIDHKRKRRFPYYHIFRYILQTTPMNSFKTLAYTNKVYQLFKKHQFKNYCQLYYICIDPKFQNLGLSKLLMNELMSEVSKIDHCNGITIDVENERLIEYYAQFGFQILLETQIYGIDTWLLYWPKAAY